jgi:hypothetical protein
MSNASNLWNREPALIVGLVQAALVLVIAFGLNLTNDQMAAILSFTAVLLAVVTRQSVVPVASVQDAGLNPNNLNAPRQS